MDLDQYKAQYEAAMRAQGISVSWSEDGGSPYSQDVGGYRNPDNWVATLSRDGVISTALVSLGTINSTGLTASELAQRDIMFSLQRAGQLGSPQGQLPSDFFTPIDDDTRRFYEVYPHLAPGYVPPAITPGPAPTVPVGGASVQPAQAPTTPNDGTAVVLPALSDTSNTKKTFWDWNWFAEQETGRVGPPPENFPGVTGTQLMTKAEWQALTAAWYASGGSSNGSGGGSATGGGGGGTANPATGGGAGATVSAPPDYVTAAGVGAALALILAKLIR